MSRSRHPRPTVAAGDECSRVTQAAIALADDITRMGRAQDRLARAVEGAQAGGVAADDIARAISRAGSGRPDRRKALSALAIAAQPSPDEGAS